MKRKNHFLSLALSALVVYCFAASTVAQTRGVRWAGAVDPSSRFYALHAPDDRLAPADPPLILSDFGPTMHHRGLRRLLDLPPSVWSRADVIAFEGNGGSPAPTGGWESSIWIFSDGTNTRTVTFNELVGHGVPGSDPAVIANGSIIGEDGTFTSGGDAYRDFFGICSSNPDTLVISYIVFDLHSTSPVIDTSSPSFSVRLLNGHRPDGSFGEGTPDPDAIGILSSCPL